jgi:hypothetical protein
MIVKAKLNKVVGAKLIQLMELIAFIAIDVDNSAGIVSKK